MILLLPECQKDLNSKSTWEVVMILNFGKKDLLTTVGETFSVGLKCKKRNNIRGRTFGESTAASCVLVICC